MPAVDAGNFERVRELAHRHRLAYALGIHPMCADRAGAGRPRRAARRARAPRRRSAPGRGRRDRPRPLRRRPRPRAPGGDSSSPSSGSRAEFGLPVLLHVRRAVDTVLKHLRRTPVAGGIAHAFNGSEQQAGAFVELGFQARLRRRGDVRARAADPPRRPGAAPLEAIVMETDSPDIPPQWLLSHRRRARGRGDDAQRAGRAAARSAPRSPPCAARRSRRSRRRRPPTRSRRCRASPDCSPRRRRCVRAQRRALPEATISESAGVRYLHLGTPWIQGAMRIDEPLAIELEYVRG